MNLEKLIYECGDSFRKLMFHHLKPLKQSHIDKHGEGAVWSAHANRNYRNNVYPAWGKTPEEAVEKLLAKLK